MPDWWSKKESTDQCPNGTRSTNLAVGAFARLCQGQPPDTITQTKPESNATGQVPLLCAQAGHPVHHCCTEISCKRQLLSCTGKPAPLTWHLESIDAPTLHRRLFAPEHPSVPEQSHDTRTAFVHGSLGGVLAAEHLAAAWPALKTLDNCVIEGTWSSAPVCCLAIDPSLAYSQSKNSTVHGSGLRLAA